MTKSKKMLSGVWILLFFCLLALPPLVWTMLPENLREQLTVNDTLDEKRQPVDPPQGLTNDYFSQWEQYYNDHAPFRLKLISLEKRLSQTYETFYRRKILPSLGGLLYGNSEDTGSGQLPVGAVAPAATDHTHEFVTAYTQAATDEQYGYTLSRCKICGAYQTLDITDKTVAAAYLPPLTDSNVLYGRCDWLFYGTEQNIAYYTGGNNLTDDEMAVWETSLEALRAVCEEKGIRLIVMVAPNKEQVYPEYMPTYSIEENTKREQRLTQYMREHSRVSYLYPLEELQNAKLFRDVYFKQDTHWNAWGGLAGAMAILRSLDMPTVNLWEVPVTATSRTGGDLSNFCGFSTAYDAFSVTYKPEVTLTQVALPNAGKTASGNVQHQWVSNSPNPAQLLLIGDSFRTAPSPYLARNFAKTTVSHRSDMDSELVKQTLHSLGEGDVLVLLAVERYDDENITAADRLRTMLLAETP